MDKIQELIALLVKTRNQLVSVEAIISAAERVIGDGIKVTCGSGTIIFSHSDNGAMLLIHNEKRRLISEIQPLEKRIAILEELATETLKNL